MRRHTVIRAQAAYYVATGLLPLVSMALFENVTGKKTDRWLVQMVGLLAASIGVTLAVGARREPPDAATLTLSVSSALSFAAIDVVHVARRRISPIYLGDAAVELLLVTCLALSDC